VRAAWIAVLAARAAAGCALVARLPHVSVDDAFRTFYAWWWWEHPSFYPLPHWPPGYFWVYGSVVGATGDLLLAPRVFTLAVHLTTGALLAGDRTAPAPVRWTAAAWILLSPLSLVLGTVPLSEALFGLCAVGGVVSLGRFASTARAAPLLAASLAYTAAATVRYEGWILAGVFTLVSLVRRPAGLSPVTAWMLRLLPWSFPIAWVTTLGLIEGDPLLFLRNVSTDLHGRGDLGAALGDPASWVVGVQALVAAIALTTAAAAALRRSRGVAGLVWEIHLAAALSMIAAFVATGNVPSQYTLRMLYPVVLFGALPVARTLAGWTGRARLVPGVVLGAVLAGASIPYLLVLEPGHDRVAAAVAEEVDAAYERGTLSRADHVLVEMDPPRTMSVVVHIDRPGRVHVDDGGRESLFSGGRCTPWLHRVRLAAVLESAHLAALERRGWRRLARVDGWTLMLRPRSSPPLACGR
jgi:hypothetical protein